MSISGCVHALVVSGTPNSFDFTTKLEVLVAHQMKLPWSKKKKEGHKPAGEELSVFGGGGGTTAAPPAKKAKKENTSISAFGTTVDLNIDSDEEEKEPGEEPGMVETAIDTYVPDESCCPKLSMKKVNSFFFFRLFAFFFLSVTFPLFLH